MLRKPELDDVDWFVEWSNRQDAYGEYLTMECLSQQTCLQQLKSEVHWTHDNKIFLIQLKNGPVIGLIHYWLRREKKEIAVMALRVAVPGYRDLGYGTEAQKFLIIALFEKLHLQAVEMYTDINNVAQQKCLAKLGFEIVDALPYEDHHLTRNGYLYRLSHTKYLNTALYSFHYE